VCHSKLMPEGRVMRSGDAVALCAAGRCDLLDICTQGRDLLRAQQIAPLLCYVRSRYHGNSTALLRTQQPSPW